MSEQNASAAPTVATSIRDDPRHPLYLGQWKRHSKPGAQDFIHDNLDEPHCKRKKAILAAHPEVRQLYGNEPLTAIISAAVVTIQLVTAYLVGCVWTDMHWYSILALAYFGGGTIAALFGVLIHESGHNLVFKTPLYNRLNGLLVNVPMVVPISQSFRRYHLEHHQFQGVEGKDPDLPLDSEVTLINNNPLLKALWVLCYGVMYVVRGMAMKKPPTKWEAINLVTMVVADALIVKFMSLRALAYLGVSVFFGYGMHPGAAHFIQEHYVFSDGQETYSYYGTGNIFYLNIGLHNEHHDFPQIPWTRICKLRQMATEFYDPLFAHTSWIAVMFFFIASPMLGPQSRLVRMYKAHASGRKEYRVPPAAAAGSNRHHTRCDSVVDCKKSL